MSDVSGVNAAPDVAHFKDLLIVIKLREDGFFKDWVSGAGKDARSIHVRVSDAGKTEVDNADDFVFVIE